MPSTAPSIQVATPQIIRIEDITTEAVGGKAAGLAELIRWGLNVPAAFVILDVAVDAASGKDALDSTAQEHYWNELEEHYQQLGGGKVAVRSSALGEDGEQASFAGQYDTVLNVEGLDELKSAIQQCLISLTNQRASAYQNERAETVTTQASAKPNSNDTNTSDDQKMCVIVQCMAEASVAGVLFTADPVSGRYDRLVIDAAPGLGEALVSGEVTPDHFELNRGNEIISRDLAAEDASLSDQQILTLAKDARKAQKAAGEHLDMEWAIEADGTVRWLQARPITTLGVDLNDGYTSIPPDHVVTRCNVGEMMPGPVCPLTFSVQGRAIEHGMQYMHTQYASRPAITDEWTQINLFFGHMFINLTSSLNAGRSVSLNTAETTSMSMCGRLIPELKDPDDKKALPLRWWGSIKFVRFCLLARRYMAEFESRFRHFHIRYTDDPVTMVEEMERQFPWLCETTEVHLRTSAYSGVMEGVVQGIVSGRSRNPSAAEQASLQAEAARLLAGASDVESAVMVEQLDAVIDLLAENNEAAENFRSSSAKMAVAWLRNPASGAVGKRFKDFMAHHGHRGYRELCVRSKAWHDEPEALVKTMQASVAARLNPAYEAKHSEDIDWAAESWLLRKTLPKAHDAIRLREQTKSDLVLVTYKLKCGYRYLGSLLAKRGLLDDADLVFFMSREELSAFCREPNEEMAALTIKRRRTIEFQERLEFEDIYVGPAVPSERQVLHTGKDGEYVGRPVSCGVVEGRARVATTLEQAAELQPGEILISHITDIGWTPYFSLIGGLATDVGSAVSHGAVIAREYGLPAIVNLRVATKVINTGDLVRLDADKGILTKLENAAASH